MNETTWYASDIEGHDILIHSTTTVNAKWNVLCATCQAEARNCIRETDQRVEELMDDLIFKCRSENHKTFNHYTVDQRNAKMALLCQTCTTEYTDEYCKRVVFTPYWIPTGNLDVLLDCAIYKCQGSNHHDNNDHNDHTNPDCDDAEAEEGRGEPSVISAFDNNDKEMSSVDELLFIDDDDEYESDGEMELNEDERAWSDYWKNQMEDYLNGENRRKYSWA